MLGESRLLQTAHLRNFLSFGPATEPFELKSLNVFIGPNASGKSNFIESLNMLRAAPYDITAPPSRQGGGISEWLWKGAKGGDALLDFTITYPEGFMPLRYRLAFGVENQRFALVDEAIENEKPTSRQHKDAFYFYRYGGGHPFLNVRKTANQAAGTIKGREERSLTHEEVKDNQSILSQRKDPSQYPEITYLGRQFESIRLYQEWTFGRSAGPRQPNAADLPDDFLLSDGSNLGLIVNDLQHTGLQGTLDELLCAFHSDYAGCSIRVHGGTVQLFLRENDLDRPIPATRLSDGTIRFLSLAVLLCHPSPPPVVCIEEPELGLHPDIMPTIAELLIKASHRTQLFVTTHSEALVDALTEVPEAVVVCEKENGSTVLRRLQTDALEEWLKEYTLGPLWRSGEIGGNRW